MQQAMTVMEMAQQVNQATVDNLKNDLIVDTSTSARVVLTDGFGPPSDRLRMEVTDHDGKAHHFTINEHAHRQIAAKIKVHWSHYRRCLDDHVDLYIDTVNKLFEREPKECMFRMFGDRLRAVLSSRYRRIDNLEVLSQTLPVISNLDTVVLGSNVNDNYMNMKVLFRDENLRHTVAKANGNERVVLPGFRLSNSETGQGSLKLEGFFYDSYCTNGCVFGVDNLFNFSRTHIGSKLDAGADLQILSSETIEQENKLIIAQLSDCMRSLSNPDNVQKLADHLILAANTEQVKKPIEAINMITKEFQLSEIEHQKALETFLRDADFSKFGLASAVTEIANEADICTYDRANEIESIGGKILNFGDAMWNRIVNLEPQMIAA